MSRRRAGRRSRDVPTFSFRARFVADPLDIGWSFSVTGWLAVLLLFVLARLSESGARMREELEGTV